MLQNWGAKVPKQYGRKLSNNRGVKIFANVLFLS